MRARSAIGAIAIAAVLGLAYAPAASAQDYVEVYRFPTIKPELKLSAGYGFAIQDGSARAGKFRYLKDSPTGALTLVAFPFPSRVYAEADYLNSSDFFTDVRYAYKDNVIIRWLNMTSFHNLDNITLVDLDLGAPTLGVNIGDAGMPYGIKTSLNNFFLRLKPMDFPFHVYANGRLAQKYGSMQQRFLGDSGASGTYFRTTQSRSVDWASGLVEVGLNAHLGPIEVDYSHGEKRFKANAEKLMPYLYEGTDTFPHNMLSETRGSINTLKLHTTYTGRLTAALTLSRNERENTDSRARATYNTLAADLRLVPHTRTTFTFKYRYRERDVSLPLALPVGYLGFGAYTPAVLAGVVIRQPLSYNTNKISGNLRVRLLRGLAFNAGYIYKHTARSNTALWQLPPNTSDNTVNASLDIRVQRRLKLRVKYKHLTSSSPAYPANPERQDSGGVTATWTPTGWFSAYLGYNLKFGRKDSVDIINAVTTGPRDTRGHGGTGNLTFLLAKGLTLNTGYSYSENYIMQDHIYGAVVYPDIRYLSTTHSVTGSLAWRPIDSIYLSGGVTYTRSKGDFSPDPAAVASYSRFEIAETVCTATATLTMPKGWEASANYEFTDFNTLINDPTSPFYTDGRAHLIYLSLSKKI